MPQRLDSLRDLIAFLDNEIDIFDRYIHHQLKDDPGYNAIQKVDGIGSNTACPDGTNSNTNVGKTCLGHGM